MNRSRNTVQRKLPRSLRAPLTPERLRFVEEFVLDLDFEAAAARAGLTPRQGFDLVRQPVVLAAIQMAKLRRSSRAEIYADEVLRRWWLLAMADAREFVQVRLVNCRHCWGLDHRYQFRDYELAEAEALHREKQMARPERERAPFDDLGGGGFDGDRDPCRGPLAVERMRAAGWWNVPEPNSDHNCPACDGRGVKSVWVGDARFYSPGAALLFDGVRLSKDGSLEVKTRDRNFAEGMIADHLGMVRRRAGAGEEFDPSRLTDDQLDLAIRRLSYLAERQGGRTVDLAPVGEGAPGAG